MRRKQFLSPGDTFFLEPGTPVVVTLSSGVTIFSNQFGQPSFDMKVGKVYRFDPESWNSKLRKRMTELIHNSFRAERIPFYQQTVKSFVRDHIPVFPRQVFCIPSGMYEVVGCEGSYDASEGDLDNMVFEVKCLMSPEIIFQLHKSVEFSGRPSESNCKEDKRP